MKLLILTIVCLLLNTLVLAQNDTLPRMMSFAKRMRYFSGKMYEEVVRQVGRDSNVIYSPLSIYQALGMILAGSDGNTKKELLDSMNLATKRFPEKKIHNLMKKSFGRADQNSEDTYRLANAIFLQESYQVRNTYSEILLDKYNANARNIDFVNAVNASGTINDWISNITEGKIDDLITSDSISALTRFILVNAIYFKATWKKEFRNTEFAFPFTTSDGSTIYADGMYVKDEIYQKSLGRQNMDFYAVPYTSEESYFVIGLPKPNKNLSQFTQNADRIIEKMKLVDEWQKKRITLVMPKFEIESETNAQQVMKILGVRDLFDGSRSNLSRISEEQLSVSDFLHKAYIKVNEKGTEAAAASAITSIGRANNMRVININRPFFFGIYSKRANVYTFLGQITRPTEATAP